MQVTHPNRQSFSTYKARKGYRKDLQQNGVKVPGGTKQSSRILVNKQPLSSSLKHNDQGMYKLFRLAGEASKDDEQPGDEVAEEAGENQNKVQASLREMVSCMAQEAATMSRLIVEEQERGRNWGEKTAEAFDFVTEQAKLLMTLRGVTPYTEGKGTIRPVASIGEVE